jgi:response regulator RpfG family c-di-GMP phosphodiesterase
MEKSKANVLVVDDEQDIQDILCSILQENGFKAKSVGGVEAAMAELSAQPYDLVFTDIRMPGRPVSDLLQDIREYHSDIEIIMITALNTAETAIEYIRLGAYDYIVKPFNLNQVLVAADRALEKRRLETSNREFQKYLEQVIEDRAAETHRLFYSMTQVLIRLLELRSPFDAGHSFNVAEISRYIARELKLSPDGVRKVYLAALLHDVGMIPIEDLLLNKKGALTEEEYGQIKTHASLAESVLKPIVEDEEVLRNIRHHHERYDGKGYPDGLKGNIIPLGARIIGVAEAFDAMTRKRPHRGAMSAEDALIELQRCADSQFDPQVVAIFMELAREIAPKLQPESEVS